MKCPKILSLLIMILLLSTGYASAAPVSYTHLDVYKRQREYTRLECRPGRRLGPRTAQLPAQPVSSRRSAHAPHRGLAAACQVQSSLYDPANRGTLPVQDDELPYLRLVPQTPAKPPRPMGNECPARLRCGKDRAVSALSLIHIFSSLM